MINGTNEKPAKEVCGTMSGGFRSFKASLLMELGCTTLPLCECVYLLGTSTNLIVHIRPETIKYIGESIGVKLMDLHLREDFMNLIPKAREVKAKNK